MLDQKGVGQLIKIATERGRAARPNLKVSTKEFLGCRDLEIVLLGRWQLHDVKS